ncbi:hypothetical protein NBRC116602_07060 [Hyphomicrobiales bacterium 4NK60-0047b]
MALYGVRAAPQEQPLTHKPDIQHSKSGATIMASIDLMVFLQKRIGVQILAMLPV